MKFSLIKTILFFIPPELAHDLTIGMLAVFGFCYRVGKKFSFANKSIASQKTDHFPYNVKNTVGLAAGLDKNARALWAWQALGFGFVEVGTVTPQRQPGNPKPRLFRIASAHAIVNRMGFNNHGVRAVAKRIAKAKAQGLTIPVGGNIGKNKSTDLSTAEQDYVECAQILSPICDYLVINVSSPNTPGLRLLQSRAALQKIASDVKKVSGTLPLFVKIAPDDGLSQLEDIVSLVESERLTGVIVANTLVARPNPPVEISLGDQKKWTEAGGLSGAPAFETNIKLAQAYALRFKEINSSAIVIGCGGILSKKEALKYHEAGCTLVQIYSGLVYKGPRLIKEISKS